MKIRPFALERYFAVHEFSAKFLLSSSDCDGFPIAEVLAMADPEATNLWETLKLGYTESLGLPLLRREIAGLYRGVSADEVLVAAPEEAIFIAMNTLLEKGDHVICTWPGYQSLYEIADSIGCQVDRWEPVENEGWHFDVGTLAGKIKPRTKAFIVNFPHNPTGYLPSKADYQKILEIARQNRIYVFSDEMYRFLEFNSDDRLPSAVELYERAISLFGMSKTFGLAGTRIGWLVIKDAELFSRIAAFKDYTTICSNAPGEILSLIALRARDRIIARHWQRIQRNLALLDEFFRRQSHRFAWTRPRAGTIAFPRMLENLSSTTFCRRVVEEAGIMLLPSSVYGFDDGHFRIGFGRENLPEVLERFETFICGKLGNNFF